MSFQPKCYNLNASLARFGVVTNSKCTCNEANETLNHVIFQCDLYNTQRNKLLNKLFKKKYQLPLRVENLIYKPDILVCKYISCIPFSMNANCTYSY